MAAPSMTNTRRFSSALAADQGIYLPQPNFNQSQRHSSYNLPRFWHPDRPITSHSNHSDLDRPFTSYTTSTGPDRITEGFSHRNASPKPNKLQPSASAMPQPFSKNAARKPETKRRSLFFGKVKHTNDTPTLPEAWVILPGIEEKAPFDLSGMLSGQPVRELWDDSGDCFVHLFSPASSKGPSFRLDSSVFASSVALTKQAFGQLYSDRKSSGFPQNPTTSAQFSSQFSSSSDGASTPRSLEESPTEVHLYLDVPLNGKAPPTPQRPALGTLISDDGQTMVDVRNFFGFLCGQSLVATDRRFSLFSIFVRIAEHLSRYQFSNLDASTFGEVAATSFDRYMAELNLADVRRTTAKAVEMLVLSEKMRSVSLYNEAFTHAVGKLEECQLAAPSTYKMISATTQTRLSRAHMDLEKRLASALAICTDFEMPSLFAGIMNSKTVDERRHVDFDAWKSSFFSTRKFVLGYYKSRFGAWPPKPSPKKNQLQTAGLSRVVLLELYNDLAAVYDLLVDRADLTNRTADGTLIEERSTDAPRVRALRHILSEWDRSSPPVKPPMPFDVPIMPTLKASRPEFGKNAKTDAKLKAKKIKSDELLTVLHAAQNQTATSSPFLQAFREFERSQAKGRTIDYIADLRYGQWIFLYAVLQALPMLVVDAPGLLFTDKVEYFLCEASRGGVPWASDTTSGRIQQWYGIAGGGGVVSLPSDVIENSIDAIYRRSHCWIMAEQWSAEDPLMFAAVHEQQSAAASLPPPPDVLVDEVSFQRRGSPQGSRSNSPARSKRESVLNLGLEAIPLPRGVSPDRRAPSSGSGLSDMGHLSDPTRTFDTILADVGTDKKKRKK